MVFINKSFRAWGSFPMSWLFTLGSQSIGARLSAGGEEGNRGWDGWMASLTQCTWVLNKLREIVKNREAWHVAIHRVTKSQARFSNWRAKLINSKYEFRLVFLKGGAEEKNWNLSSHLYPQVPQKVESTLWKLAMALPNPSLLPC